MVSVIRNEGECCGALTMYGMNEYNNFPYNKTTHLKDVDESVLEGYKDNINYGFDSELYEEYDEEVEEYICKEPEPLSYASFKSFVEEDLVNFQGSFLIQVIVTDYQLKYDCVKDVLKHYNFKFVTKWVNLNTQNVCNLFVTHNDINDKSSQEFTTNIGYDCKL